ncbi:MAG: hypothetical protein KKF46_02595 [Nanoarchaeota archaeon]|nr:hypothetical protein [Nanoarchaeota archaeon]MBU1321220.1 hypothetical protein [Nanoarchaeota archaeon]MBU1597025.1 hypothetical protein [Nanoarchaeota archaeon]MBU2441829.1 hypothetical protein [Nanoarchaeota archaeon]
MSKLLKLREKAIEAARKAVIESVSPDLYIINTVNNIEELQRIINVLTKRLREWYGLYLPELDKIIDDNESFASFVAKRTKKALQSEFKINKTMGADIKQKDIEPMISMAKTIGSLITQKDFLETYLENTMKEFCPNLFTLAGGTVGAKLLRGAGSLRKLAMMRSSTIQLLGAEKALFRHIKTGARPPKYGFLMQHNMVQSAKKQMKGKVARALADKIFLAARIDFFQGEFIADELLKGLEVRFK